MILVISGNTGFHKCPPKKALNSTIWKKMTFYFCLSTDNLSHTQSACEHTYSYSFAGLNCVPTGQPCTSACTALGTLLVMATQSICSWFQSWTYESRGHPNNYLQLSEWMTSKSHYSANPFLISRLLILPALGVDLVTFITWKLKMAYTKVAKAWRLWGKKGFLPLSIYIFHKCHRSQEIKWSLQKNALKSFSVHVA